MAEERRAICELVATLTSQNKEITKELDEHCATQEIVRRQLNRKQDVSRMIDTFNRDFQKSKLSIDNHTTS